MKGADLRTPRVLIVDDMEDARRIVSRVLAAEGFETLTAPDGVAALGMMRRLAPDVVLLDLRMPGMDGLEVLREARTFDADVPVLVLTAFGSITSAVEAVKNGAYDYLTKPFENRQLVLAIRRALESRRLKEENRRLRSRVAGELSLLEAMGASDQIRRACGEVERVAPTNFTVVITGETGAGKELVARAIHRCSLRASAPFVPVDCASIPPSLMESELFGHERGSFTGAIRTRPGKFELASGGTLFLDEAANLPLPVQPKLLRALQEKQICRVGGTSYIKVDIRVVVATNRDLAAMVEAGDFRRDLFHRLNEFAIRVPPLRERREDIIYLAKRFLDLTNEELNKRVQGLSEAALEALLTYFWPGNVRELRNVIRRAVLLADVLIAPGHLAFSPAHSGGDAPPSPTEPPDGNTPLKEIVRRAVMEVERNVLARTLRQTAGNKAKAARLLQIDYKTIHTKVKQYGISV